MPRLRPPNIEVRQVVVRVVTDTSPARRPLEFSGFWVHPQFCFGGFGGQGLDRKVVLEVSGIE